MGEPDQAWQPCKPCHESDIRRRKKKPKLNLKQIQCRMMKWKGMSIS
jgi:hypothetical protein